MFICHERVIAAVDRYGSAPAKEGFIAVLWRKTYPDKRLIFYGRP